MGADYTTLSMRVREKPWWLGLWNRSAPMALFGTVYLPKGLRERLSGTPRLDDILDHEAIHVARQHAHGMVRWHLRYVFDRRFRWREERAAYHSSLTRMRDRGDVLGDEQRDRLAAELASRKYLFMTSRAAARAFIDACLAPPAPRPEP